MKKASLIFISLCLILISCPFSANATGDKTVFYLDFGDVIIGDTAVSGYDENKNPISDINPAGYVVTQKYSWSADHSVTITDGTQNVELYNLNVERTGENDYAVGVLNTATAKITLSGENTLTPGTYRAGVDIALGATAIIDGDGVLNVKGIVEAAIGGGMGKSNGTLIINSGTIFANGGTDGYGAGIGGGSFGNGGTITINGGNIVATGGVNGAGIGGGFGGKGGNITINGGTITATGGTKAAGIGGGFNGNGGTIIVDGGSVKATGSAGTSNIGNGYGGDTVFGGIKNSAGNAVALKKISLKNYSAIYQNGIDNYPITAGHPEDDYLYFYTELSQNVLTVYNIDESVCFYIYNSYNFEQINPFKNTDKRIADYLVVSDKNSVSFTDGFTAEKQDEILRLIYNNCCIDKFEAITRGDANVDSNLDGMDAVIAACVESGMLSDRASTLIADYNNDGVVNHLDVTALANNGIGMAAE